MAFQARNWKGGPPAFIVCGEELLEDEDRVMAKRLTEQGVNVVWEQYKAMLHVFGVLLGGHPAGVMSIDGWCKAIKHFVERPGYVQTSGTFVTAKKLERLDVDVMELYNINDSAVTARTKAAMKKEMSPCR